MVEKESVEIEIPKKIVKFLRAMELNLGKTMEEYMEYSIIQVVAADLDSLETFAPEPERLIQNFGLQEIFRDTGVSH